MSTKYHLHEIETTNAYPHMPYWQRLRKKIVIPSGAIVGFRTGVTRDKVTACATAYFIRGVLVRRPLSVRDTWSVHMTFVPLLKLPKEDLAIFYEALQKAPEWELYSKIREASLKRK